MPSAPRARIEANLQALSTLRRVQAEDRAASMAEQQVLAGWSAWGAVPGVFDDTDTTWAPERTQLRTLLSPTEWDAAARTTINAHYTDPRIVTAMWEAMTQLGFGSGTVLEPGCGSGTFLGLAPPTIDPDGLIGVELDPTTAAITTLLYPQAQIRAESFADTALAEGSVDAVLGNVPFGDVTLHDPVHNSAGLSIHNHFIAKSVALCKPGGIIMVLSSRWSMDAVNPAARRVIGDRAELLGALRLPNGAHQRTAGTDVVTDLLVLRRRDTTTPATDTGAEAAWETSVPRELPGGIVAVNTYFTDHPEHVLGDLGVRPGRFGPELAVTTDTATGDSLTGSLAEGLRSITTAAVQAGRAHTTRELTAAERAPLVQRGGRVDRFVGHISTTPAATGGSGFSVRTAGGADEALVVPASRQVELRALLGLRDAVVAVLAAEAATAHDTTDLGGLRSVLHARYTDYLATYGALNRVGQRPTGRVDPDTGEKKVAQVRPPVMRLFATDPFSSTVRALEFYDPHTQTATGAAILSQRVVAPRTPRLGADTPADAAAICLDTHGELRMPEIARLLGVDEPTARTQLQGLAFDDPETGALLTAAEYLSGNVRARLVAAEDASRTAVSAGEPDVWAANVSALQEVIPRDLEPGDIDARLGAAWIGADDVQAFLVEVLKDPSVHVMHTVGAEWKVTGGRGGVLSRSEWGTERMAASQIAQHLLTQTPIRIMDVTDDGARVFRPVETAAAQEKATALGERFADWVWEDPARARRLARVYNDTFNAIVLRSYDTTHMSLPGLARSWTPRPHQLAAVARMVAEPNTGLFHEVGAGKTAEMAIGVMELRRLGMVAKPAIVVPNHMLDQFSTEFLQLYPQARVLAAGSDDLAGDKRLDFVARATTGDWDAVIMTRTAFTRLEVTGPTVRAYLDAELTPLRESFEKLRADGGDARTVKAFQTQLLRREERLKTGLDKPTDPGVSFEQTGIDYLVVDELHDYKNLSTPSNMADAAILGSDRAQDLHIKVEYLRTRHNGRALTGATATPIANSITEAYVMQRYLRPDLLREAGVHDFDTWAATFGSTVSEMEMSPDGGSWRMKTRFARFRNVPEFLRMWHVAADIKTAEDLGLPVPDLVVRPDGHRSPETVVVARSDAQAGFVADLGRRADAVRNSSVDPSVDNMLKISSEGRAAALDLRLLPDRDEPDFSVPGLLPAPDGPTKLEVAADRIHALWATHAGQVFTGADGAAHPRPGGLQLVFCDLGTPREGWNAYDELRTQLVERGVPDTHIAYIHSTRTDRDKAQLFAAARTGGVQVLIGSTAKMGVGTNVQARAVALHHLDCPWRPADLAQRDGRIVRQGNQNPEVQVLRYVTEATFDTYLWQTVERKARFINQVMKGRLDSREIEDIGAAALSFSEVKALASGDPLVLEKAEAENTLAGLERSRRAHTQAQANLRHQVHNTRAYLDALHPQVPRLQEAISQRVPTRGESFTATIDGLTHPERAAAAAALTHLLTPAVHREVWDRHHDLGVIGALGGFQLRARTEPYDNGTTAAVLSFVDCPARPVILTPSDVARSGTGVVVRLENSLNALERDLVDVQGSITTAGRELALATERVGAPFPKATELAAARAHRDDVTARMNPDPPTAATEPAWAAGLVPRPENPEHAAQWDATMAMVAAYREQYPVSDTDINQPLGPAPAPGTAQAAAYRACQRHWTTTTGAGTTPAEGGISPHTTSTNTARPTTALDHAGIGDRQGLGHDTGYTHRRRHPPGMSTSY